MLSMMQYETLDSTSVLMVVTVMLQGRSSGFMELHACSNFTSSMQVDDSKREDLMCLLIDLLISRWILSFARSPYKSTIVVPTDSFLRSLIICPGCGESRLMEVAIWADDNSVMEVFMNSG